MRILITGAVLFVIWAFFSAWLYNDVLLPVINKPETVQLIPESPDPMADSLAKIIASMPKPIMIFFDFDKTKFKIDPQAESRLPEFKSWMEKYPASLLSVTGHADIVGTPEYNQELAFQRAQVIVKYLEEKGFKTDKITTQSMGESESVINYITSEGRAMNRNTEISIKMK